MICEIFNKMGEFIEYVFDVNGNYVDKVELSQLTLMTIMFLVTLFVISWWFLPIRLIFKKYGNITFYCKNKKGE